MKFLTPEFIAKMERWTSGTGQELMVHNAVHCEGQFCPIHRPSNHHMKDWPLHFREDRGIMERICKCGVGHLDPDDYKIRNGIDKGIHGCDGCCEPPKIMRFKIVNKKREIFEILIDEKDYNLIKPYSWHVVKKSNTNYYVCSTIGKRPNRKIIKIHRLIMGARPGDPDIDHINRNGLDNRRLNMRFITHGGKLKRK